MPIIQSEFRAAWWLPGAHVQTIWPSLFRRRILPDITWERVGLDDGDFIDLAWSGPAEGRIVLFMYPETAPCAEELPANVWLEIAESGGHMGFVRGLIPGWADYWAERRIAQWLSD